MSDRLKNVRIVDPVLTNLAQGYHNNELVGESLFPIVEIAKEAGVIPTFGRESFKTPSTERQVRGASNRLSPEDIGSMPIKVTEHDLEYPIDYREVDEASFQLRKYGLDTVQNIMALIREKEVATLALDATKYAAGNKMVLAGEDKFSSKTADVLGVFDDAIEKIRQTIGRAPNVCVIPRDVWIELKTHSSLIDKIKYVAKGILTPESLAELVGVKHIKIGRAVADNDGVTNDVWSKDIVIAYSAPQSTGRKGSVYEPSYGYTVRKKGSLSVDRYNEVGGKVEIVRATDIIAPHLVGAAAGYLIKNCV